MTERQVERVLMVGALAFAVWVGVHLWPYVVR